MSNLDEFKKRVAESSEDIFGAIRINKPPEDEDDPNITDQQLFGVVYPFDPDNVELY